MASWTAVSSPASDQTVPLRAAVAALPAYVPGARPSGQAWKLSSNENPYPPPSAVVAAITEAATEVNRYPDMFATELVEALATHVGVEPEQVVVGNGSVAVLQHVLEAVLEPGDEVVYPWRSFEAYPIITTIAGGTSVTVPVAADGRLDLPAMAAAVGPRTRAVLVCTPNNPTGPVVHADELETFLATVPRDVLVVVDEAYLEFIRDPEAPVGIDLLRRHPNVVLVRTMSKASGLAGLRVGYAVAAPRLATAVRSTSTPFGVNHVAQRAALATLQPAVQAELAERVEHLVTERTRVWDALRAQGWEVPATHANFVWLATGERTAELAAEAAAAGVLVRPFAGEGMRVSIGEVEANDAFLELAAGWL
ncbi:histidinol-phosphate transaminase [Isoptericola sp. AK164]|uniref:histidinol-phosphate transaminase n=1 Tax=Isoptericola sp. AK164 TaxID=3024246 RepID=UPI0024185521|nr:histidinol-phosphate transaminase [Isoptericola sp. AK164]